MYNMISYGQTANIISAYTFHPSCVEKVLKPRLQAPLMKGLKTNKENSI